MIRELTAVGCEEIVTLLEGVDHISEFSDAHTRYVSQLVNILGELGLLDVHRLVRTPGRDHHRIVLCLVLGILDMIVQVVYRVVGGTNALHVVVLHQATCRELRLLQLLVTLVEDLAGCLGAQLLGDAEGRLQFQVCPVVQRITEGVGHRLCPLLELLPVRGVLACAILLVDTVGTHSAPLIVVTTEPELCDALETMIVGHHLGDQVTVIVDNRHLSRVVVIQVLSRLGLENEVIIIELLHNFLMF